MTYDAVIISDLHLGAACCEADQLEHFLADLPPTRRLVLCGDVLQDTEHKLKKSHWRVLSALRKLSDGVEVAWLRGNHDPDCDSLAGLIGAAYEKEYVFFSGEKALVCIHGDAFDDFIRRSPWLTWAADQFHLLSQRVSPYLALYLKRSSKTYLRCAAHVKQQAVRYARRLGADVVVCGHTHHAEFSDGEVAYVNAGCWAEPVCHYVLVRDGAVELRTFRKESEEQP